MEKTNERKTTFALLAPERVVVKGQNHLKPPRCKHIVEVVVVFVYKRKELVRMPMFTSIEAIVTKHFEVFVGDVADEFFDKFSSRDGFGDKLIIFVAIVMKSNIFTIITINSRHSNNRTTKITTDIFDNIFRVRKGRFGIDIKAIGAVFVAISLGFFERRTKVLFKFV